MKAFVVILGFFLGLAAADELSVCIDECETLPRNAQEGCRSYCYINVDGVRRKRSFVTDCLRDCNDLPAGHRAPCRADCIRGYNWDDCMADCDRYPEGSARNNCHQHCNIFGGLDKRSDDPEPAKRSFVTDCLKDCDDLPAGTRAPCRGDCLRGYNWDDCMADCDRYPEGSARNNCHQHCNIFGGLNKRSDDPEPAKRSFVTDCLKDCDDLPAGTRAPCRGDCLRGYGFDECMVDCERYPEGSARNNCHKFCIIFGSRT